MTTEFFDSFDGTRLALHRIGSGQPFVLLHGLFSNADMNWIKWGHADTIAAAGYEVLMLDFRVHGQSEAPHDPAKYPENVLVRDVAALVDQLGLEDYVLGGFSLGARTSLHAVVQGILDPQRLVIGGMGTAGLGEWTKRSAHFLRVIDEFDTIERGDPAYFSMQFLKSQGVDRLAARMLLQTLPDLDLASLQNISMPTLVVCGDEDRDNGSAIELAELLPNASYSEIPGTHMSSVTKPDLGAAIADWLEKTA
ncbi:alpha/beta fold hydrolase [Parerythrobacter jejuensis]|uniref:Alpha/beta fold hydrolase n=1 Tax=Parerythrobacter jejuensis TaxID=795812 RepID=A0A845ATB7_9SPHN|nr:alpha/beta fold hydrolase [Parerythrobacter jejuensis]MXP32607.1 alpha/beta fold hydrolase [Parerythrobacter jejuensis]